jgi:hypothetical protein
MSKKYKIGNISFGCLEDKQMWILRGVIDSLNYIGKETNLSITEEELRKLAIKQITGVIKSIDNLKKIGNNL